MKEDKTTTTEEEMTGVVKLLMMAIGTSTEAKMLQLAAN